MNIHEYQAKAILKQYGVNVQKGYVAYSIDEAVEYAKRIDSSVTAVKAQIHAGGRGAAGGVKLAYNLNDVRTYAKEILGKTLITKQTGPEGKAVRRLFIEEGCNIDQEYYLGLVLDRKISKIVLIGSEEGGIDIEEVAAQTPDKIFKEVIDPAIGLTGFQVRRLAFNMNIPYHLIGKVTKLMLNLYKVFIEKDCLTVEINPLVTTKEDKVIALDAKMNFDSNALFRQKDILELRDLDEEERNEIEASKYDLSYIQLAGNIGCMVNGAGLAMATMDIIKHYGGDPANFLDVGGDATPEKVAEAFKIIVADDAVSGIFVNVFGGIMRCDYIAAGIIAATRQLDLKIPLVVRLEGTKVDVGKQLLNEANLNIIAADSIDDGAKKIVKLVKQSSK